MINTKINKNYNKNKTNKIYQKDNAQVDIKLLNKILEKIFYEM